MLEHYPRYFFSLQGTARTNHMSACHLKKVTLHIRSSYN